MSRLMFKVLPFNYTSTMTFWKERKKQVIKKKITKITNAGIFCEMAWLMQTGVISEWKVTTQFPGSAGHFSSTFASFYPLKKKNAQEKEIQYRLRTELVCYWFNRQLKTPLSSFKSPKLCYRQEWHRMSHSECQGHGAMIQPSPGEQNKHWWVNVFKSSFFFFFAIGKAS